VASSSPRDVVAILALSIPFDRRKPPTASARELPKTKLYSVSPRGSAWPTSLMIRPLSGPLTKHLATCSSVLVSEPWTLAESNAKCALGAAMPQALRMASSMLMELAVGELGGGRAWFEPVFWGADVVTDPGVLGCCLSEPHPLRAARDVKRSPTTVAERRNRGVAVLMFSSLSLDFAFG
jgi:hypothetical protein